MPTKQNTNQPIPSLPLIKANDTLSTLFIDGIRVEPRLDGLVLMRLTTFLPDGMSEQVRVMTTSAHLQKIIDALCQSTRYYPPKPAGPQAPPPK